MCLHTESGASAPGIRLAAPTLVGLIMIIVTALMAAETRAQSPGSVIAQQKISSTEGGLGHTFDGIDFFGSAIAPLGDMDGDGIPDIAVGARFDADIGAIDRAGTLHLLFLNDDGTVKSRVQIGSTSGGLSPAPLHGDSFGSSLASLGDLDGDGVVDLAVGAPFDDTAGNNFGAVYILFLNINGTVKATTRITAGASGFTGTGIGDGEHFGESISVLGDLDGDGIDDILVGHQFDDDGFNNSGSAWVLYMNTNGTVKGEVKISNTASGFSQFPTAEGLGAASAGLGDLDGDGVEDVVLGIPGWNNGGGDTGAAMTLFLDTDGSVKSIEVMSFPLDAADQFGHAMANVGDLDGDGIVDLLVGAPNVEFSATASGECWMIFMNQAGGVRAAMQIEEGAGGFTGDLDIGDEFGRSAAAIGDVNGDGVIDVAVGAQSDDDGGNTNTGAVWILFLDGEPNQVPFVPFTSSLEGRAGRTTIVRPPDRGDIDFDVPIVVVPKTGFDKIAVEVAEAQVDGSVVFSSEGEFATGAGPTVVAQQDFNGDGVQDVVTSNSLGGSFSYLEAQPGVATEAFASNVDFLVTALTGNPVVIASADFDGDSDQDVAVGVEGVAGTGGVAVFLGDGLGGFTFQDSVVVDFITDLAVGDVDGDTVLDIITTSGVVKDPIEQGFATVLLGDGSGNFSSNGTFATGKALVSVLLADFDGTTGLDAMVVAHEFDSGAGGIPKAVVNLWAGDNAGAFSLDTGAFTGTDNEFESADGIHPAYGAVGDLDNANGLDLVYTEAENISHPPGTFDDEHPPVVVQVLLNDGAGGFTVTPVGTAYVGKGVAPLLEHIAPVDLGGNPDGNLDIVLVWYEDSDAGLDGGGTGGEFETFIVVLVGNGDGTFTDPAPNQFLTGNQPADGDSGDVNGDAQDGGTGGLDLVIPNLASNTVSVLLGDGSGSIPDPAITVVNVDDLDPGTLPGSGIWSGGPREARLGHLDGDGDLDMVVYNAWFDEAGFNAPVASLSLFLGDGTGNFAKSQYLALAEAGEFMLADVAGSTALDVVVTQRTGVGADTVHVHIGNGLGMVSGSPTVHAVPAGQSLTGGLTALDVDGVPPIDLLTTVIDGAGDGSLLVYENVGGTLTPQLYDLMAQWTSVRSLDVGDLTGDAIADAAVGSADGELVIGAGVGDGTFASAPPNAQAAAVGGGAIRIGDLNGDGDLDVVASARQVDGDIDQAFVRTLRNNGDGTFEVETLGGVTSSGSQGALRPLLADMNADGATDVVLVHGAADSVSSILNNLNTFETFGSGKPGKGGLTPRLIGKGYTTPGSSLTISVSNAVGGGLWLMWIGVADEVSPFIHVQSPATELFLGIPLFGPAGAAGAGFIDLPGVIPVTLTEFVGVEVSLQVLVQDFDAGPPAPEFISFSNGLKLTITN